MKKIKNKVTITMLALTMLTGAKGISPILAATVTPGGSFSASFSCGANEGSINVSASNATITSGGNWCDRNGTVSATATAGGAGTASISFTAGDLTNTSSMTEVAAGTYLGGNSVTVAAPPVSNGGTNNNNNNGGGNTPTAPTPDAPKEDEKSGNVNLASLSVSQGELSPAFNADIMEYTVNLAASVTKIKVDAAVEDAKSSVAGVGEIDLKAGDNPITVTVTAENGTTKSYVINAKVDEKPQMYVTYNAKKLGVVRNTEGVSAPATFEKGTIKLNGKDIDSWVSKTMKTTLVYLIDEKTGEKNFYIYDTTKKEVGSIFKPITILGKNVFIVDIDGKLQKQNGLTYKKVKIDTSELMGWEYNDNAMKNYALIYVMDENGKMQYYQYEKTQNTLQLYSGAAPVSKATFDKLSDKLDSVGLYRNIFIGTTVVLGCSTIGAVILLVKNKKRLGDRK